MSVDPRHTLPATALAALAATVLVVSALMLVAMLWPLSTVGGIAGGWLPITEIHQARADRSLRSRTQQAWNAAEQESRAELRIAPLRTAPWMRLAYIDAQRHGGRLTSAGLSALQHAYDFSPYGDEIGVWRLAFAYDHWDQLTPEIRREALDETGVLWQVRSRQAQLKDLPELTSNDAGRLAAALAIADIQSRAAP